MLSKHTHTFTKSNNSVGQKLSDVLDPETLISPPSIAFAMGIIHLAAAENTDKQLTDMFGQKNTVDGLIEIQKLFNQSIIKMANCFVFNEIFKIKDEYLNTVKQLAMICVRNFSQPKLIAQECNDFIAQGTNNLIQNIVKPDMITSDTVSILINTLYFKTVWRKPFKKHLTTDKLFDEKVMVPMMKQRKMMAYFEDDNVQMIELVYEGEEYGMVVALPKNGDVKGCSKYLFNDITFKFEHVDCEFPKFTQRKNIDLKPLLMKNGVSDLFSSGECKLSSMSDQKVYVSCLLYTSPSPRD